MKKSLSLILFVLLITSSPLAYAAVCNPAEICTVNPADYEALKYQYGVLQSNYQSLNTSYFTLLNQYSDLNTSDRLIIADLSLRLGNATAERDYYRALYENSSLGKISVRDFYMTIDNLVYNFNQSFDDHRKEINMEFTEIHYYIFILIFAILLEIVLFKLNLFKTLIKIKGINFIYKKSTSTVKWIKQTSIFISMKKLIFVKENENSEHNKKSEDK